MRDWREDIFPGLKDKSTSGHRLKDREDFENEDEQTVQTNFKLTDIAACLQCPTLRLSKTTKLGSQDTAEETAS